jgi:hypothetical protein
VDDGDDDGVAKACSAEVNAMACSHNFVSAVLFGGNWCCVCIGVICCFSKLIASVVLFYHPSPPAVCSRVLISSSSLNHNAEIQYNLTSSLRRSTCRWQQLYCSGMRIILPLRLH